MQNRKGNTIEFLSDLFQYSFLQYALLAGFLASIACGIVGTYIVTNRISYLAAGIAHSVLGGMGIANYLHKVYQIKFIHPLHGAVFAGLVSAIIIGMVSMYAKEREDTIIGAIWAIGMAMGILFIYKTPGYDQDLMSYLFGNILMVSSYDLWLIGILDAVIILTGFLFYNHLAAISFDREFAAIRGLKVERYYFLLLIITALTVVLLVTVVGIIMVIALLTIPVAIAGIFSRSLWRMMVLAIILSAAFTSSGLAISYQPDLPSGAVIILLSGSVYLLILLFKKASRRA